jgi:hypothetical protein
MTTFIFEDGNTYYFKVEKREYSNDYHNIYVFEKIRTETKGWFGKVNVYEQYVRLNDTPELISVNLNTDEIKRDIKKILISTKASYQLKDWDGFVGDIPNDVKVAMKRDESLKELLG